MDFSLTAKEQDALHANIIKNGWASFDLPDDADLESHLLELACSLGTPKAMRHPKAVCHKLRVLEKSIAAPSSLSKQHGTAAFPMHTDTAHWTIPCRYIVLGCMNPGDFTRSTRLVDWSALPFQEQEIAKLKTAPFKVSSGRQSFYSTILTSARPCVRYDMTCMTPANENSVDAKESIRKHLQECKATEIQWGQNRVAVLDNWRMLHARSESFSKDTSRELLRVLLK